MTFILRWWRGYEPDGRIAALKALLTVPNDPQPDVTRLLLEWPRCMANGTQRREGKARKDAMPIIRAREKARAAGAVDPVEGIVTG